MFTFKSFSPLNLNCRMVLKFLLFEGMKSDVPNLPPFFKIENLVARVVYRAA